MDIFQIVVIAVISTVLISIVRAPRPEFALAISIVTGLILFWFISAYLDSVVGIIKEIMARFDMDSSLFSIIIKIIAISYICEFGANLCKDAGQSAVASKVELAGKILIIYLASPIILSLLDLLTSFF